MQYNERKKNSNWWCRTTNSHPSKCFVHHIDIYHLIDHQLVVCDYALYSLSLSHAGVQSETKMVYVCVRERAKERERARERRKKIKDNNHWHSHRQVNNTTKIWWQHRHNLAQPPVCTAAVAAAIGTVCVFVWWISQYPTPLCHEMKNSERKVDQMQTSVFALVFSLCLGKTDIDRSKVSLSLPHTHIVDKVIIISYQRKRERNKRIAFWVQCQIICMDAISSTRVLYISFEYK